MIGAHKSSMRVAQPKTSNQTVIPAPIKGMDARVNAATDNPEICLFAINMIPNEYGMRVRSGYREWQIGLGDEVRTIIPYYGLEQSNNPDRIFAVTADGIYDVTVAGDAPVNKLTFATSDEDSGWGNYINYITEAGESLIFYADGSNGLFTYDPDTDTWAQTAGITEVAGSSAAFDVTSINYVIQHKLRIWLVPKGSGKAWYLPVRSIAGEAAEFFFAQKFRSGGDLVGLYNWTVDGGNGRDDHLVAVSRAGDVIPWTGEDPADTMTWTSTGVFFIGTVLRGNRIATEYGGELFLLSTLGVITMSDLLKGGNPSDPFRNLIGYRIARLLRQDTETYKNVHGWEMKFNTSNGSLVIACPQRNDETYRQYVYNLSTGGWGLWRGLPILSSEVWNGKIMFGDKAGRILRMDVGPDNVSIDGSGKTTIDWYILSSYMTYGAPAVFKRIKLIRPNFLTDSKPSFNVYAHYDFLIDEPPPPTEVPTEVTGDTWDGSNWDQAHWTATVATPFSTPRGVSGIGRSAAIAMVGSSYNDTFFASWDILWDQGGFL